MSSALHPGDCLDVIPRLVAEGVVCDAVVTDPPYHLTAIAERSKYAIKHGRDGAMARLLGGFMNQTWDGGDVAFRPETWATIAAALRPGAFLVAFGGTRTYHRLVCAIEDAGFVIQDTIAWLYGSGFPKRRDMLKPAMEMICLAYKPGGKRTMQVDECRIATDDQPMRWETPRGGFWATDAKATAELVPNTLGRWPANVCHDGSEEVTEAFAAFGESKSVPGIRRNSYPSGDIYQKGHAPMDIPVSHADTGSAARFFKECQSMDHELFLWRAKTIIAEWNRELASTVDNSTRLSKETAVSALKDAVIWASRAAIQSSEQSVVSMSVTPRELRRICESATIAILSSEDVYWQECEQPRRIENGCLVRIVALPAQIGTMTITITHWRSDGCAEPVTFRCIPNNTEAGDQGLSGNRFHYCAKADKQDRWGSRHPTVKPVELMKWLVALVTPPGGLVLDPFAGSGTTGVAALATGRNAILIEREDQYIADIHERLAFYEGGGTHSAQAKNRNRQSADHGPLFAEPFNDALDCALSYDAAIQAIGERVKAGEPLPTTGYFGNKP